MPTQMFAVRLKNRDTLIEQSNILIKQSVGQVVPCQLTESGYATGSMFKF